ncbi:MAG TPA: hypothetical protein VN441_01340 [Syntrophomonas sp.]|nr:hypothetical protein [Syntrophomonas sp.]
MIKNKILVLFAAIMLVGSGLYFQQNSSYHQYKKSLNEYPDKNEASLSTDGALSEKDEPYVPTPEDIAIDKTLKEGRTRNEKLWKEMGGMTSIFPATASDIDRPSFNEDEYGNIYDAVREYMSLHSDRFYEFDDSVLSPGMDTRIDNLVYGEESQHDQGILKGYAKENLDVTDVKKRDGDYTTIITGRISTERNWEVLAEGNYYELREILLDQ